MKICYNLVFSDKNLKTKNLCEADFNDFKNKFPQIAELLLDPEKLTKDVKLMEKVQLDSWQSTANVIMNTLWKFKGANIFHYPVNPEKLGIRIILKESLIILILLRSQWILELLKRSSIIIYMIMSRIFLMICHWFSIIADYITVLRVWLVK